MTIPWKEEVMKLHACSNELAAVEGFLAFLKDRTMMVAITARQGNESWLATVQPAILERLVYEYFGIDKSKLDAQLAEAQRDENAVEEGRADDQSD